MSTVHQQFRAEMDASKFKSGMAEMEMATRKSTSNIEREMERVNRSSTRVIDQQVSGRNRMMRAGQVSLQVQDIGIQIQQGVRASTIAAQQGSQLASLFGPKGMIIGGVIAIGALMYENLGTQKKMLTAAEQEAKTRERMVAIEMRKSAVTKGDAAKAEMDHINRVLQLGEKGAEQAERRLKVEKEIAALNRRADLPDHIKEEIAGNIRGREAALDKLDLQNGRRTRQEADVNAAADPVLERARRNELGGEGRRAEDRAERARARSLRTAARQIADEEDRERRDNLRRPMESQARAARNEAMKQVRENALEKAAGHKDKGTVVKMDAASIEELVRAINGLIPK